MAEIGSVVSPDTTRSGCRRGCGKSVLVLLLFLVVLIGGFALYVWIALDAYSYSKGDRAGYVQKFSRKGWICKTWEGELAMVNLPGTMPQIFEFSVRDDAVAERINQTLGQRVSLTYEQHVGVPTSCFGETDYFVTAVRSLETAIPQAPQPFQPPARPRPPGR
jgi:hypothetical protein